MKIFNFRLLFLHPVNCKCANQICFTYQYYNFIHFSMVNYDNFRTSIILALLLYSISSYSQNHNEAFPEFKKYKTWGYHFAPVIYNRATITPREGTVTIKSLPMTTMGFGFTKLIKPENKISFKTGVYIEVTPLYRFNLDLKSEDVYDGYRNITDLYGAAFYRPVITGLTP